MAIINSVNIIKFFYIIFKALFLILLVINKIKKRLLRPISNYFAIIYIYGYEIIYLHCLI